MQTSQQVNSVDESSNNEFAPNITFIDFLLDETGSMSSCLDATKIGFDAFVADQRGQHGECYLTLSKFDSDAIRTPYENLAIGMVPPLSFYPSSMTNLYDCIGNRLMDVLNQERVGKSLFVIMTDGEDNTSRRYTVDQVRQLIKQAIEKKIVVVFLGPSDSALDVGTKLGISSGNIKSFHTDEMCKTMNDLTNSTTAFRAGSTDSKAFFA